MRASRSAADVRSAIESLPDVASLVGVTRSTPASHVAWTVTFGQTRDPSIAKTQQDNAFQFGLDVPPLQFSATLTGASVLEKAQGRRGFFLGDLVPVGGQRDRGNRRLQFLAHAPYDGHLPLLHRPALAALTAALAWMADCPLVTAARAHGGERRT